MYLYPFYFHWYAMTCVLEKQYVGWCFCLCSYWVNGTWNIYYNQKLNFLNSITSKNWSKAMKKSKIAIKRFFATLQNNTCWDFSYEMRVKENSHILLFFLSNKFEFRPQYCSMLQFSICTKCDNVNFDSIMLDI